MRTRADVLAELVEEKMKEAENERPALTNGIIEKLKNELKAYEAAFKVTSDLIDLQK